MGYGAKDKPVPWLGPQAWIKEVHWVTDKSINVTVGLVATANDLVIPSGNCVATAVIPPGGVATGYILKSLLHYQPPSGWPLPETVDTDPTSGISIPDSWYPPPRISNGRTARKGDESPEEGTDPIRPDEVLASGMPTYPTSGGVTTHGAWTVFAHGFTIEEPTGPYVDFRPRGTSNPSTRFRKGTDFLIKVWAVKYTGAPLCYGSTIGDPGGSIAATINVLAPWESWSAAGNIAVDFSGAEFTYKKRKYKPVARYTPGPYGKAKTPSPRYGFEFQLLCEIQKED